ncbi:MAG: DUF3842 family protein [Bacillota bacterium]|nr:DUF3842 family protein [Bacillota bacterium]
MRIGVIDGQGGGIGCKIVEALRAALPERTRIVVLGTNAVATANMLRAGANEGASGENAIVRTVRQLDLITGSLGIVIANSFLGEMTPKMAEAIGSCTATKLLLPLTTSPVRVVGTPEEPLPHLIGMLVEEIQAKGGGRDV